MKLLEKLVLLLLLPSVFLAAKEMFIMPTRLAYLQMASTNNFNELAIAFTRYGNDHDNELPLSNAEQSWIEAIDPYLDRDNGAPTYDVYTHPMAWELNKNSEGKAYGSYGYNDSLAAGLNGQGQTPWKYSDIENLDAMILIGEKAWDQASSDRGLSTTNAYPKDSRGPAANHRTDKDPSKGPQGGMAYLTPRFSSKRVLHYPGPQLLKPVKQQLASQEN